MFSVVFQCVLSNAKCVWPPAGEQTAVQCAREVLEGVQTVGTTGQHPGAAGCTWLLPGCHWSNWWATQEGQQGGSLQEEVSGSVFWPEDLQRLPSPVR